MNRNPRDVHGDGHGFVDVPVGRKPEGYRFNPDLSKIPMSNEPFLGLYGQVGGVKRAVIIWRASKPTAGLRFLTLEGSHAPHYMTDPLAWAELPKW